MTRGWAKESTPPPMVCTKASGRTTLWMGLECKLSPLEMCMKDNGEMVFGMELMESFRLLMETSTFQNGNRSGCGMFVTASGERYVGEFLHDKMHGHGLYISADGLRYEGDFKEGKKCGQGTWIWKNESKSDIGNATPAIEEKYSEDVPACIAHNAMKYKGEFQDDEMHGQGVCSYLDGGEYAGQFVAGKAHGLGVYKYTNGESFEGEFADGKMHGRGLWTFHDGTKCERQFNNGKLVEIHLETTDIFSFFMGAHSK
jgi:hypothetical protein